jgi:tetratricopeptide (TPR) repeat protein
MMKLLLFCILCFSICANCIAQGDDPLDPFSGYSEDELLDKSKLEDDSNKSPEQLLREAIIIQYQGHILESRTKLLKALEKDPKFFQAHMALADYYSRHVGHFRLALKYAKQAENLFKEQYGNPPYVGPEAKAIHGDILMILADSRLNLDDYDGALQKLKEFEELNYYSSYLASSKAWVLMKLGKYDEAIKSARFGLITGSNIGHTLNVLGILLSITGERQASLDVFKQALRHELSLGESGNPATPLNNSGEVYKELYQDEKAKKSWEAALNLPDGCEHVLPSMNLTLVQLDELDLAVADATITRFEECIAQFPLKNGEEHRALVKLARGRIALHSGRIDEALELFEKASEHQQWFGKIGTNIEDLQAAVLASLHYALIIKNNHLEREATDSWFRYFYNLKDIIKNELKAIWLAKRAKNILINHLAEIEDLYIRHTDSMLEYPTLGDILKTIPRQVITSRIEDFKSTDDREHSISYYQVYLAESLLNSGYNQEALDLLNVTIPNLTLDSQKMLKAHALNIKIKAIDDVSNFDFIQASYELLKLNPAGIINYGVPLVVKGNQMDKSIERQLYASGWVIDNSRQLPIQLIYTFENNQHVIKFNSLVKDLPSSNVVCQEFSVCVNALNQKVFVRN